MIILNKPAILLITTDEQHLSTVFDKNNAFTLNGLNKLMEDSTSYINTYSASPVCLPSRCTWASGKFPHKSGCISNHFGGSLPSDKDNIFTYLKKFGYKTSLHGKCHFIPVPYPATSRYFTQEYEHFINYYKSLGISHLDLQDDKNNSLWYYDDYAKDMEKKGLLTAYREAFHGNNVNKGFPDFPLKKELHPDSWVGEKALKYLDSCNSEDTNFTWVSFSGPHYPMDAPKEYVENIDIDKDNPRIYRDGEWDDESKIETNSFFGPGGTEGSGGALNNAQKNYDDAYWKKWRSKYYGNIVQIDSYIEKIITKAKSLWKDNLMVIFTSDHGDMMGNHSLWGKNTSLYEDVVRVPLIVHYPYQKEKAIKEELISSVEVFPTILKTAGYNENTGCDGFPLQELDMHGSRDYVISECDNRVTVIKDNFKLCINLYSHKDMKNKLYLEMYDLNTDPNEFINIYSNEKYAAQKNELISILEKEEKDSRLLSIIFYNFKETPYWYHGKSSEEKYTAKSFDYIINELKKESEN